MKKNRTIMVAIIALSLFHIPRASAAENVDEYCKQHNLVDHPCFRKKILEGSVKTLKRDLNDTIMVIKIASEHIENLKSITREQLNKKNVSIEEYKQALDVNQEILEENKKLEVKIRKSLNEVLEELRNINSKIIKLARG